MASHHDLTNDMCCEFTEKATGVLSSTVVPNIIPFSRDLSDNLLSKVPGDTFEDQADLRIL